MRFTVAFVYIMPTLILTCTTLQHASASFTVTFYSLSFLMKGEKEERTQVDPCLFSVVSLSHLLNPTYFGPADWLRAHHNSVLYSNGSGRLSL
ncbi:hypothetical protein B0O80DRAFT_439776 [Mortierella sp. GBAus27b]|nr:hypothetical protein B0O80DRAFT_439776 [Mortierella sp. GBAus27b]